MKRFACGEVIPGCAKRFEAASDEEILAAVARHAREDHHIEHVDDDTVAAVLAHVYSD